MNARFFDIIEVAVGSAADLGADSIAINIIEEEEVAECFLSDNRSKFDGTVEETLSETVIRAGGEWEFEANEEFGGSLHFSIASGPLTDELPEALWKIAVKVLPAPGESGMTIMLGRKLRGEGYSVLLEMLAEEGKDSFIKEVKELERTL